MIIKNAIYSKDVFEKKDLFIFAIGYEHRSYYLFDQIIDNLEPSNILAFVLDDFEKYDHTTKKLKEIEKNNIRIHEVSYSQNEFVQCQILDAIKTHIQDNGSSKIHIDYSSMPRSWYCSLPIAIQDVVSEKDSIFFWYAEGLYPSSHKEYPSAGIDSFSFFSGKPSLQIDKNRIHIVGLSYDVIRTQAILSITDPSYLVSCFAYNPQRDGFADLIKEVNKPILSRSAMTLSLHLDDFEFMVSKLCETANELLPSGDVILIPDGPKPLIFAISLVPKIINKEGITCLHISRNDSHFQAVDVSATGEIKGFMVTN